MAEAGDRVDVVLLGTPVSQRTRRRERLPRWIDQIASAISASGAAPMGDAPAKLTVEYYYDRTNIDLDNPLKPILDALKRALIADDRLIVELWARKRTITSARLRTDHPANVADALTSGVEFIHVRVERAAEIGT